MLELIFKKFYFLQILEPTFELKLLRRLAV